MAKARGGRGPSRRDLRAQSDAAEAREREETEGKEEEEEEPEEAEEEADAESEADEGDGDEEGGKKRKAKKKAPKKAAAPKKPSTKRSRAAKEVRRQAVWVVFDNSSKPVEEFPYNQKAEAEELLARKLLEKEGKATFYLNLVKKEIKDKE